jgi:sugar phosphate isomerase/epimerase
MAIHDVEFVSITSDFDPASVQATLEAGAELGAKRVSAAGDDPVRPRFVDNFAKLCELASAFHIGVDLENMGWRSIATFADTLAVLNEVKPSAAGALVDALHFYRNGGELSELAECPQQFIKTVQVCDVAGPEPATRDAMIVEARSGRAAPGEGDLNLTGLLNAAPIEATVSVEVPISRGVPPSSHLNHLFKTTRALLDGMLR